MSSLSVATSASAQSRSRLTAQDWQSIDQQVYRDAALGRGQLEQAVQQGMQRGGWGWPEDMTYFVTDPHADLDAFLRSLAAVDLIRRHGPGSRDFQLTPAGRDGHIIIGGDCLDKGPSNLELLRGIRHLMDLGARVTLLVGNHDLRFLLGLRALDHAPGELAHGFFLRMCPKAIPLLREVHDAFNIADEGPDEDQCRARLLPPAEWFDDFPRRVEGVLSEPALGKEIRRLQEKRAGFEAACRDHGLTLRQVYPAAMKCRELFLQPDGEFAWFFGRMKAVHREGAFLFLHAGIDDQVAELLHRQGPDTVNQLFQAELENDAFAFYFGPLAGLLRTKYRAGCHPLTHHGVERLRESGIHALAHGHQTRDRGQRLELRAGLLHIECDITLDRNSRAKQGLAGDGLGVTVFCPDGQVIGISNDCLEAKLLDPYALLSRAPVGPAALAACFR